MLLTKVFEITRGCRMIVELGKNNSGKGTCAAILKILFDKIGQTSHIISMSKIIGKHINKFKLDSGHKLGEQLAAEIQKQNDGKLMSDEPVIQALLEYLIELNPAPGSILIFDGFPRTMVQWRLFVKIWPNAEFTFHEVSDDLVRHRANIRFLKEGRKDDKPSEVENRLVEYHTETAQVVRASKKHAGERGYFKKIEATWPIREQIKVILRFLGFGGNMLGSMLSCFDDKNHEVAMLVKKITDAEKVEVIKPINATMPSIGPTPTLGLWMFGVCSQSFSHFRGLERSGTFF